jgi:uncharacterized protein (DUF983 family)
MSEAVRLKARCSSCGGAIAAVLQAGETPRCSACGHTLEPPSPELSAGGPLRDCCACGGQRFYRRRDLPRLLGLIITGSAAVLFLALLAAQVPFGLALLVLLATAGLDAWLYSRLKEVTVCYRCAAEVRGNRLDQAHQAFDIHIAEEYR